MIEGLLSRRSVLANNMTFPGPSKEETDLILKAAHRVPDHGKIGPWRFIVFEGESRNKFSKKLSDIFLKENPNASENQVAFESNRLIRAPLVICVVYSPNIDHKVPVWEQQLAVGAVCQNILNASHSFGYGAQWLTEWYSFNSEVDALLALKQNEQVAGFIYVGSFSEKPSERNRPELSEKISFWR